MSDVLALDWEHHQLYGVEAQVTRGAVRARRCFSLTWPEDLERGEDPPRAGAWLRGELDRAGVSARQVLVSLPREDVVVRKLELPDAPDDELADLVRMQAATKLSSSLDQLQLDFLPLPSQPDVAGREVLMATVPKKTVARIRAVVEAAGLELQAIGISPVGAAELAARAEERRRAGSDDTSLVLARHGKRVEISLMRGRRLLFTHSSRLAGESDQRDVKLILAEVNRSSVALQRLLAGQPIAWGWVVGRDEENRGLCESLSERLSCEVTTVDPLDNPDVSAETLPDGERAAYAGPVGMLLAAGGAVVPSLDFLNPRKSVVKPDRRRLKAAVAAAAAVLVAATAYGGALFHRIGLDREIALQREEERTIDELLERGQPVLEAHAQVEGWTRKSADWLEELHALHRHLGGTERLYLRDFQVRPATGTAPPRILADGYAREPNDVYRLWDRLREAGYDVAPKQIPHSGQDDDYPYRFTLDLEVTRPRKGSEES